MFNGGFTFSICPHGVEHHMHAELPSCCRMEQEKQQQKAMQAHKSLLKALKPASSPSSANGDKTNSRDAAAAAAAAAAVAAAGGVTSGDESATSDHEGLEAMSKCMSPLSRPLTRLNLGAFKPLNVSTDYLDNNDNIGAAATAGTNGRVQRLCASPCSSAITSVQSTPDDYLGLGLHVHPLTDPW
jgi:hypothetical protein